GLGVAHGVGDDFLCAAQQDVGPLRVVDQEGERHVHVDPQPGHVVGQRQQGGAHVDGVVLAQPAHRLAHVAQQQLGQGVGLGDVLLGLAADQVVGDLQVQAQGGQVVAEQVVQL